MEHKIVNGQHISRYCLVCGIENPLSLQTRFYETAEHEVIALFTPRQEHQSYPGVAHGGISAALLDETIGRAIMAIYGKQAFGVTVDLQVQYKKPVPLEMELKVVGRVDQDRGRFYQGSGELYLPDGTVAVTARGKYLKRKLERITDSDFISEEWFPPPEEAPDSMDIPER
jgi:uncharacterized protein (TIGR00369 family)